MKNQSKVLSLKAELEKINIRLDNLTIKHHKIQNSKKTRGTL